MEIIHIVKHKNNQIPVNEITLYFGYYINYYIFGDIKKRKITLLYLNKIHLKVYTNVKINSYITRYIIFT